MGVAVLNPKVCLQNPLALDLISPTHRVRPSRNPNRQNKTQSNRKKRSPNTSLPSRATIAVPQVAAKNLVMGQVKILKRGQQIATTSPKNEDLDLGSTHRLGPDPQLIPAQIRLNDSKATGSAFVTSPPPSSLPLPTFFTKKSAGVDDATSDLRRILGLTL